MRRLSTVSARAGIVVTGTEVLTGRVQDRNGPWIADRLLELGVELAHITICGDRPADIEAQLRFMADQGVDLIITSGGLGPTADDMTVEVVARFCGRELALDDELENRIAEILKSLMARNPAFASLLEPGNFESVRTANRKQAMIPVGSEIIDPGGHRTGRGGARQAGGAGASGAAARASAHVAQGHWDGRCAAGDRGPDRLPTGHGADVRAARVGTGRDSA